MYINHDDRLFLVDKTIYENLFKLYPSNFKQIYGIDSQSILSFTVIYNSERDLF